VGVHRRLPDREGRSEVRHSIVTQSAIDTGLSVAANPPHNVSNALRLVEYQRPHPYDRVESRRLDTERNIIACYQN